MPYVPPDLVPRWEQHWPGLLDWELSRLEEQATNLEVDEEQLKDGLLVVRFDWPFNGSKIPLETIFPASYPFLRPQVRLLTDPNSWPERHVSPIDGNICLLGRDTAQWTPALSLAQLLSEQLEDALLGKGVEDPQGEPAEVWWNSLAPLPNSYCLIDSAWDLGETEAGKLEVRYVVGSSEELDHSQDDGLLPFRAVVTQVFSNDGKTLAGWSGPLPEALRDSHRKMMIPWHRSETTLLPRGKDVAELIALRKLYFGGLGNPHGIGSNVAFRPFAVIHPIEIAQGQMGLGWIVGGEWGPPKAFQNRRPGVGRGPRMAFLPIMRAGKTDLGYRVPASIALAQKRVAVFGTGAIGAPIVIELARNGCSELRLVDHDVVEPGNSIRWPLGAEMWGRHKVRALQSHLGQQYPGVVVVTRNHQLGGINPDATDDQVLDGMLADVDLVVDATVAGGVNYLLWDRCNRAGIPLVRIGATPSLGGGAIVRHIVGGGCPVCLQWAREADRIPGPPGADDGASLIQPPGCGERTFLGADYDLQELSLQAVRLIVETLGANASVFSVVQTLSLANAAGDRILPTWQEHDLPQQPECCGKGK